MSRQEPRYWPGDLRQMASALLAAAGMEAPKAEVVAKGLLEGDLMGATTHGLALCADYVEELENGDMTPAGQPEVLSDFGAVANWDGKYLPGVWLTREAVLEASRKAQKYGVGIVAVRKSHHIASLGHYLLEAVERGELLLVYSSDPSDTHIAPFGGLTALFTPNPIAVGIPANPHPILVDVSTSITTAGLCGRCKDENRSLPGKWIMDQKGELTDDPHVFRGEADGTILPIGGLDHGHKGYGLSLMVESLTQGLSGFGRPQKPVTWGAAVTVQVIRPEAFGPPEQFLEQTSYLVQQCLASKPRPGVDRVVLPGQRELERRTKAMEQGVALYPGIMDALAEKASKYGIPLPPAV